MDLKAPKKKRVGSHIKHQQHFPIFTESETGLPVSSELWPLYIGHFTGDSVIVCNTEENVSLYTMGFFGKGSFSRGYPSFSSIKAGIPPIIKERQWQRRKVWLEKLKKSCNDQIITKNVKGLSEEIPKEPAMEVDYNDSESLRESSSDKSKIMIENPDNSLINDPASDKPTHSQQITDLNFSGKVLVLADSDDEDIERVLRDPQPHLEDEPVKTAVETINLTLEEAFFLSYALGCLQVIDMSDPGPMTIVKMWQTFCETKSDFIESYVVYHYFRAKGWVVKCGHKFGGDFLLYKQGPPFYHASYIVIVEKLEHPIQRSKNLLTWKKMHGLNRLAENSGKEIIITQVLFPNDMSVIEHPKCLPAFQVNELLIRRWISSQERVEKDEILNTH